MNINQAAAASGLSPDTIRFYERKGVLPRPPRGANGYRSYAGAHVATLRLAGGLRQLAVPLDEVRPILEVAHAGVCGDIRGRLTETLTRVRAEIEHRIEALQQTSDHVGLLLSGLKAMQSDAAAVPGTEPCPCVAMVTKKDLASARD